MLNGIPVVAANLFDVSVHIPGVLQVSAVRTAKPWEELCRTPATSMLEELEKFKGSSSAASLFISGYRMQQAVDSACNRDQAASCSAGECLRLVTLVDALLRVMPDLVHPNPPPAYPNSCITPPPPFLVSLAAGIAAACPNLFTVFQAAQQQQQGSALTRGDVEHLRKGAKEQQGCGVYARVAWVGNGDRELCCCKVGESTNIHNRSAQYDAVEGGRPDNSKYSKACQQLAILGTTQSATVVLSYLPHLATSERGRLVRVGQEAAITMMLGPLDGRQATGMYGAPYSAGFRSQLLTHLHSVPGWTQCVTSQGGECSNIHCLREMVHGLTGAWSRRRA